MIGNIVYQEGMFLGKEELERQQSLMKSLLVNSIRRGQGIGLIDLRNISIISVVDGMLDLSASVTEDIVAGTDSQMNLLVIPGTSSSEKCRARLTAAGTFDAYLYYRSHSYEPGTLTVDGSGYVTGSGTQFTKIFRSSIKGRYSRMKTSDGEMRLIQNVIDDTNMQLYGEADNFISGQNLQFQVYPTLSTFYSGADEQPSYLYDLSGLALYSQGDTPDQAESFYFKIGTAVIAGSEEAGWTLSSWNWSQTTKIV